MSVRKRTFLQSLNDAVEGFIYVIRYERNMRVHFLFAFLVLLVAIFLGVRRIEWIILSTIVSFVLVAEMANTAIEKTVDAIFKRHSPEARTIKHISAGFVLVAAFNALLVGYFIFARYLTNPFELFVTRLRYAAWQTTFAALLVVLFTVIAGKAFFGRGTPFRGGAISGHSAIAFALWTAIAFTNPQLIVVVLSFCIAALVAQSRLRAKIHSFWEVVAGACLGILITALFFQIFRS